MSWGDALYVMLCTVRCPAGALNVEEHGLSCSRETRGLSVSVPPRYVRLYVHEAPPPVPVPVPSGAS